MFACPTKIGLIVTVPNRNFENLSEPKPSILEPWFGLGLKISIPSLCRNHEKPPENRETESELQKNAKNRRFGTVKNCLLGTETETETGNFGSKTGTAKHPRGSGPPRQLPKSGTSRPDRGKNVSLVKA